MPAKFDSNVQIKVLAHFDRDALSTGGTPDDISKYVRSFEIDRQRSRVLDATQPGLAWIVLDNRDGRFDPANGSSPYSPNVKINKRISVSAIHSGSTYDIYTGLAKGWPQEYPGFKDATVTIQLVDGFNILSRMEQDITDAEKLSGNRIGSLLTKAGWPSVWRDVDTGTHNVQALTGEFNTILGEVKRTELVEQGTAYIAGNGDFIYRDADTLIEDQSTSISTFTDTGGGLNYTNPINRKTDDTQLWNRANVTRRDGTEQSSSSTASVDDYGSYDLHLSETLHLADGEALALADWFTYTLDDPEIPRVPFVTLNARSDTGLWPEVLGRDFLDRVTVSKSTFTDDFHVFGVTHRVNVDSKSWNTTFKLEPVLASTDWWILGTSELGTDTRLGY